MASGDYHRGAKAPADITQKLNEIRAALDEVIAFQKTERRSKILGAVQYFQELAQVLSCGEVAPASRQKLEDLYTELTAIQIHLREDVKTLIGQIQAIEGNDRAGTDDLFRQMRTHNETLTAAIRDWHQCVGARLMSWYILMCYAGENNTKAKRHGKIQESIDEFYASNDGLAGIAEQWNSRIARANAFWNFESTLKKRRAVIREQVDQSLQQGLQAFESLRLTAQKGTSALAIASNPIELAVRLGTNGKVEAWQLVSE